AVHDQGGRWDAGRLHLYAGGSAWRRRSFAHHGPDRGRQIQAVALSEADVTENEAPAKITEAVGRETVTPAWARAVTSFPPSDRILSTILTRQAERYGDRVLLVAGEARWTFAQTAAIAAASAQALVDAGIKPGDRVAL